MSTIFLPDFIMSQMHLCSPGEKNKYFVRQIYRKTLNAGTLAGL